MPNQQPSQSYQKKQKLKWINPLKDRTRVIPFIVPNQQQRKAAIGSLVGEKWRIKRSIQAIINDFDPIKKPQPGDNLYQYEQDGQDYPLFNSIYRNHINLKEQIIYVVPFKCNLQKSVIREIIKKARSFFHGAKVKLFQFDQKIDLEQFDVKQSEKGQKYYDAAKMNTFFAKLLHKNTFSVAIITSLLIYNGDRIQSNLQDIWVFGLGSIKDRTSIISYEQILNKDYDNQKEQGADVDPFNLDMLSKVVNHQLCHTFAMKHCIFYTCLMNGSNGYHEASTKVEHLCPVCLRKLQSELNFDIVERYQALGDVKSLELAEKIKKNLGENK